MNLIRSHLNLMNLIRLNRTRLILSRQILLNQTRRHLNLMNLIRPNLTPLIPILLIRLSLTRHRLNLNSMNPSRLSLTPLIPSPLILSSLTRHRLSLNSMNPSRLSLLNLTLTRLNLTPMSLSRTLEPRLPHSQFPPNKQTDKRKKGLRVPKETVNEGTSSTHLLKRPTLTPIICSRSWHAFNSIYLRAHDQRRRGCVAFFVASS
jgi:hypothetical protein